MTPPISILYVDDYAFDREMVRDVLAREPDAFRLVEARSRAEFEARLDAGGFDLILSDFNILGFDALQLLAVIKARCPHIPVLVLTGTGSEEIAVECLKNGAADYLIKGPKPIQKLPFVIRAVLERARIENERARAVVASQKLSRAVEQSPVSVAITDRQGIIEYVNPRFCQVSGYSREELLGQNPRIVKSGKTPVETYCDLWTTILGGGEWHGELLNRKKNGDYYWEREIISPIIDAAGEISHFIAVKEDVTEQKRRDAELRRLNKTLTLLRECSVVLVHEVDEAALLEGVCRRIADTGGYLGVWAGFAEDNPERRLRPVTVIGIEDAARLATINGATWGDAAEGIAATAVRGGQAVVARVPDGGGGPPWSIAAAGLGVAAAISLPLRAGGIVLGAICIYAAQGDAFDDHEVRLLSELADDLAYGLVALREAAECRRVEQALNLHRQAVDSSSNGIMIAAVSASDTLLIYVNPAFEQITGYLAAEALGKNPRFLVRDDREQIGLIDIRAGLNEKRPARAVLRNYRKDGSLFWNELSLAPVGDGAGRTTHFIGIINDVTERVNYETQLEHQANHDALTGLANRNLLTDRMEQAITYARRANRRVAIMLLDLDRFKVVNDSLGHGTGDALLKVVAERLSACVRPGDTVARLGGDEFVVVMADVANENDVAPLARHIFDLLSRHIAMAGHDMVTTASLGIALYPRDGEEAETLLKNADIAMYRAKDLGRNSFQFYTPEMNARTLQRLELETGLRRALERNELVLFYQPKVELQRGQVVGAEALIRWRHPLLGMVSPADFIPLAEETGLIVAIGEWVIETACDQIKLWRDQGLENISVAVNVSARQFEQEDLTRVVEQALRLSEVPAHCLELELTESAVMQNPQRTETTLRELKRIGVRLALDDFGTGYSSLNYLKRFPIDVLKIDQSFVRDITVDPDDAAIAVAVISLAHSLKRSVVAEGVETEAQLLYLRRNGCDDMQGYYFSRPLPAEEFAALLGEGRSLSLGAATAGEAPRTLLLVDDEPSILASLQRLLRTDGYRILTASSAAEGFELLALNDVQVIVSDQRMPEMSGTEFLGRVKEMHPDTVRIVLSGYTDLQSVTDAINHGAIYKFLTKPWEGDLLREHIRQAFMHHEAQRGRHERILPQ